MRTFKLFWNAHKWTGIALAASLSVTSVTGFLLLVKKRVDWIQPPTLTGAPGDVPAFISLGEAYDVVFAAGHPGFTGPDDVDRIDVRPGDRVYKVRSKHDHAEIQVCAVTGEILNVATRRSDLIEEIHDGSFFGDAAHGWYMPAVSAALLFMVFSGLWLWIEPGVRKRRRRRRV